MANQKECVFCGAKYDDMLAACPYCGTTNYKGAEAAYLKKLEEVRSDMEELGNVPEEETRKEWKRQGKVIKKMLVVIVIFLVLAGVWIYNISYTPKRDAQADYAWQQQNLPVWDELYEQKEYEKLAELYQAAVMEGRYLDGWEHDHFCDVFGDVLYVAEVLEDLKAGRELLDYEYEDLVYYGWKLDGPYVKRNLTEEEAEVLKPYIDPIVEDFNSRWEFTEKEREEFIEDRDYCGGLPSYQLCEEYIERWLKER